MSKTVVIDCKNWCRGTYHNVHGKYCAIGFLEKQHPEHGLSNKFYESFSCLQLDMRCRITGANDTLYGDKRKKELRKLFKMVGFKVKFVNSTQKKKK